MTALLDALADAGTNVADALGVDPYSRLVIAEADARREVARAEAEGRTDARGADDWRRDIAQSVRDRDLGSLRTIERLARDRVSPEGGYRPDAQQSLPSDNDAAFEQALDDAAKEARDALPAAPAIPWGKVAMVAAGLVLVALLAVAVNGFATGAARGLVGGGK